MRRRTHAPRRVSAYLRWTAGDNAWQTVPFTSIAFPELAVVPFACDVTGLEPLDEAIHRLRGR